MMSFLRNLNIWIDNAPAKVSLGYTIMQGCASLGLDIPKFCYHDKLLIAGNCRICLVELLGSKKLVASCAVQLLENSVVFTNTVRVRLARQNVLEFLLANHPLDCPICDQGGECDLQDITAAFGADRGRFYEYVKRSVLDKDFGPLIRTSMNRCIHCTRCVRFMSQSTGAPILGTIGRGYTTEISNFVGKFLYDELSGNITDICPVGALTSKPYSFKVRPWELSSVESVDILDSLNSNILFDVAGNKIYRVLPYANEFINEEWITNKARYSYDALTLQRLDSCLLRVCLSDLSASYTSNLQLLTVLVKQIYSFFSRLSWKSASYVFFFKLFSKNVNSFSAHVGALLDLESLHASFLFMNFLGSSSIFYSGAQESLVVNNDFSQLFLFNTGLSALSRAPSFCFLVGTNPRLELPLLNLRLSRLVADWGVPFFSIGGSVNYLTFHVTNLSTRLDTIFQICEYRHSFCTNFYSKKFGIYPLFLIGSFVLDNSIMCGLIGGLLGFCRRLFYTTEPVAKFFSLFREGHFDPSLFDYISILALYSSRIMFFDLPHSFGHTRAECTIKAQSSANPSSFIYSLGASGAGFERFISSNPYAWITHQGSHGGGVSLLADLVFPTFTYAEQESTYVNISGLSQLSPAILNCNLSHVRSNTDIFVFNLKLSFNSFIRNLFSVSLFRYLLAYNYRMRISDALKKPLVQTYSDHLLALRSAGAACLNIDNLFDLLTAYRFFFFFAAAFSQIQLLSLASLDYFFFTGGFINKSFIIHNSFSLQPILNYYGDDSNPIVISSKTMSLASNQLLTSNFSFTTYYV